MTVGDDGTWAFEGEKRVEKGEHNFRADRLDETGDVIGRASIGIVRLEEPKPAEQEVAAAPQPAAPAPVREGAKRGDRGDRGGTATPPQAVRRNRKLTPNPMSCEAAIRCGTSPRNIMAAAGATGPSCAKIAGKIRNPHWIYPDQQFRLP